MWHRINVSGEHGVIRKQVDDPDDSSLDDGVMVTRHPWRPTSLDGNMTDVRRRSIHRYASHDLSGGNWGFKNAHGRGGVRFVSPKRRADVYHIPILQRESPR